MGIELDPVTNTWRAWHSERHPVTKTPKTLRRKNIKTEAEARRCEKDLALQITQAFHDQIVPMWPTLVGQYLESKSLVDWSGKTHQNAKLILEAHTFEKWKRRRVDSITPLDVKTLLHERLGDRPKGTQQTVLKFIRGAFQFAVEQRCIHNNPAPNIRFKLGNKIRAVLTEPQVRVLLEKAHAYNHEWFYHWALAIYTGMRNGELYSLTWDRVNFENGSILVNSGWNSVDGFKETKSCDDRMVDIAPNLGIILRELKLKNFDSNFVLPRSRNWDKGEQARVLRMFLQGIGLPEVRFHDLRATWATIMLSKGVEPIKVMSMGGWKQLKTMQIYIRMAGVDIKGIASALDLHDPVKKDGKLLELKLL